MLCAARALQSTHSRADWSKLSFSAAGVDGRSAAAAAPGTSPPRPAAWLSSAEARYSSGRAGLAMNVSASSFSRSAGTPEASSILCVRVLTSARAAAAEPGRCIVARLQYYE